MNKLSDIKYKCVMDINKVMIIEQIELKKQSFEVETMQKLSVNRKRENFESLKLWDQERAQRLRIHRYIADEIDNSLQTRITESNDFLKVLLHFLNDLYEQQNKYEHQHVTNPEHKLKTNLVSRNIYLSTSRTMIKLYNETQNLKNSQKHYQVMERCIRTIEAVMIEGEKQMIDIRTKIELIALEIQNSNKRTLEKCNLVSNTYNRDKNSRSFDVDFFTLQQSFVQEALEQTEIQREYGEKIIQYLQCVQKYEKQKLNTIKQTLQSYLQVLQQYPLQSSLPTNLKYLIDILQKRTQIQYISLLYSSDELLSAQLIEQVSKLDNKRQRVDIKYIKNFLKKYVFKYVRLSFVAFDCRNVVLKEYRAFLKEADELEGVHLICTVDGFLNIFHNTEDFVLALAMPDMSFQLSSGVELTRQGDISLVLNSRKRLLLSTEDTQLLLVFINEDQREEFLQFVNNFTK